MTKYLIIILLLAGCSHSPTKTETKEFYYLPKGTEENNAVLSLRIQEQEDINKIIEEDEILRHFEQERQWILLSFKSENVPMAIIASYLLEYKGSDIEGFFKFLRPKWEGRREYIEYDKKGNRHLSLEGRPTYKPKEHQALRPDKVDEIFESVRITYNLLKEIRK